MFEVHPFRFHFQAQRAIRFAPGTATNTIRGAFGTLLRKVAPSDVYQSIFEPKSLSGPSGLLDSPRPFVIRAACLDGLSAQAGESFSFDVHLFGLAHTFVPYFGAAFQELAKAGLGPGRIRVVLSRIEALPRAVLALTSDDAAPPCVTVRFVTPTEIKNEGRVLDRPSFPTLIARVRDRVSTLGELYGDGPLDIDFRGLVERASSVVITRAALEHVSTDRSSTRTGQTHPLGGVVGEIVYSGDLREFLPYLRAAQWTGVGRHTVWGHGHIMVS